MILHIFDGFDLCGAVTNFTSIRWTRRFNSPGSFEITMPFSRELFDLLAVGRVVYKRDTDEAAFIQNRNVFADSGGAERIEIRGAFLSEMLSRRIVNYTANASAVEAVETMVRYNMIEASNLNRNIPDLVLEQSQIMMESKPVKMENKELLQAAVELCGGENLGFRVRMDPRGKQYKFELYQGRNRESVVFSKQFGNVQEQDFYEQTDAEKNTVLVDNGGSITIVGDDNSGLSRRETYTTFNSTDGGNASAQGELFLKDFTPVRSMDTVIDTLSTQFLYLQDWDLGDVVTCKNSRWGVTIQKNILEIEEYYDEAGKHLSVTFGDCIPTIKGRK